jgi:hypothetical protein
LTSRIYHTVWDNTCAEKFPLVSMGGRAEGQACADPGARTPIGASGNFCVPNYCLFGTAYTDTNCQNSLHIMWYLEPSPGVGCFSLDPDLSSYLRTFLSVASNESIFWNRCKILGYASMLAPSRAPSI